MTAQREQQQRVAGLFDRLAERRADIDDLRDAAQLAVQVEFTTIPAYLSAMYSISDTGSPAYAALRSVAMEEMFHVNQAANLLVGLGGEPRFTGSFAPVYPTYLPRANPRTTPLVGLYRASKEVFSEVFAEIERPAPHGAPPQGDNYDSIAQLYDALARAIEGYPGDPFTEVGPGRQRTNIYLGKFGGTVVDVRCKKTARQAIDVIVRQGEGSVPADSPLVPFEPFGAYQHYGMRTDGTYGPIMGTPYELSHFMKFTRVAEAAAPFPSTRPIASNPKPGEFDNPNAAAVADVFDTAYSVMLHALERTFSRSAGPGDDPYFGIVFGCMCSVLPHLARELMSLPAHAGGNASVGPNAAPLWRCCEHPTMAKLATQIEQAIDRIGGTDATGDGAHDSPLAAALEGVKSMAIAAKAHGI